MADYGTEVKLLVVTPRAEELIEYAGRLCWDTTDKVGVDPGRIQKWIKAGHESLLEHASATFYIKASRVFTHELVRHRIASYSQRSQRYVSEEEPRYIVPPELEDMVMDTPEGDHTYGEWFEQVMDFAWHAYESLLGVGVPKEIARYVLPNACETQIVMTMNFRELRHFIKLRTSLKALPEMREVAGKIREVCKELAPKVFEDV